jgi:putative redox protein
MPSELTVTASTQGGLKMLTQTQEHQVFTDYLLQPGVSAGMKPLELLLASLSACAGSTLYMLLGRAGVPVAGVSCTAHGQRRDEHPTIITEIRLDYVVRGKGLDRAVVERQLAASESKICPVYAMLKPGTPIASTVTLEEA